MIKFVKVMLFTCITSHFEGGKCFRKQCFVFSKHKVKSSKMLKELNKSESEVLFYYHASIRITPGLDQQGQKTVSYIPPHIVV